MRKAGNPELDLSDVVITDENVWETEKLLGDFNDVVRRAWRDREPSVIAKYALNLARTFNKPVELALEQIEEKNPTLANKELVAHEVGTGAVVFHDLMNERIGNFDFKLEEVVRFEGDTGPYVQYANNFVKSLYVVGGEQREHFMQMKAVLKEMGYEWSDDVEHIPFGLITVDGKKLSTRSGRIILLKDVLKD
ncbi:arginine--tRNA ligase [Weissella confusa]|uniref:arginine--tRNA ligase n=1 Tax=Weissella confusa TaxID=1583 RepID=A0A923SU79_WEICO|nr:arginine--tRNA ligase [Weissella confusa]